MKKNCIITIGREYGSGGRIIGEKLAKELNIPFYNKEIIDMAAEQSGMSKEVFEKVDETAASSLLYSIVSGAYMFGNHVPSNLDLPINDKLFILQTEIMRDIAKQGSAVIVGRCADYSLRDEEDIFNIFIHAKLETRIQRAINEYGFPSEKADAQLAKMDKKRSSYYRYYTGENWGNSSNYHLCLDSSLLSSDSCVEVIKTALRQLGYIE